ncbi:DNA polymerase III subunit gamma/tau [Marinobacterium mangrovicola]|uniref:DNA polymerase III subunit gamma/tau n=1 Tax=Marinobacterium mangrovicola TaxID=1476959 RepID=A0A4R1GM09_9GAMM|nr:DNA polymerase III subunit gamma/tau [Marinobacterium mangrovicola]TCK08171.1 DNA polymerase III gamma subunit /DNA polymerase III tau subunit [Marinobacterium mangrovicola]
MSYQVLARKWRPRRFQEMVGQEHVLKALVNALDDDRLHHAYLFTGTRGVGKTSIARLFAKSLNCEQGVSSEPCGQCTACREIAEGRFVDLIEVDAASRTKVEDTRELLENVQYAPTHGRFKVYLIDEVHMLSSHSFNALLKTLEEPPPHVKFLLATTDPQKLPVTILSRCLQFNLKNLIPERIVSHLRHVLEAETISFEDPALWLLARSADGSMRDALSLTDQAIAFGAGSITEPDVRAMLGTIDQRLVYRILEAVASHNGAEVLAASAELADFSPDYSSVLGELISLLHRIALAQAVPTAVDNSLGDLEQVKALAARMRAEDVQLYYQIAVMGRKDLPFVPHAREGLEMVLLRMLAFRPAGAAVGATEPPASLDATASGASAAPAVPKAPEAQVQQPAPAQPVPVQPSEPVKAEPVAAEPPVAPEPAPTPGSERAPEPAPESEKQAPVQPQAEFQPERPEPNIPAPAAAEPQHSPAGNDMSPPPMEEPPPWDEYDAAPVDYEEPSAKKPEPAPAPVPAAQPQPEPEAVKPENRPSVAPQKTGPSSSIAVLLAGLEAPPASVEQLTPEHWVVLSADIGLTGMTESLARSLSLEQVNGADLCFHYNAEQEALLNQTQRERIAGALKTRYGEALTVEYKLAAQTRETPAQFADRRRAERKAEAIEAMKADPVVQQILEQFGAHIDEESVTPVDPS